MRILSEEAVMWLLDFRSRNIQPPRQIIQLKEQIDEKTRVAELHEVTTGFIDLPAVFEIVRLNMEYDHLFADWAEGKLSDPEAG